MTEVPGSGDCEARLVEWAQPVLFATSWVYVLTGLAVAVWVTRTPGVTRSWGWLFALGLVTTGLGSVDYHGPVTAPQPLAHDGGLALALLIALGVDVARITGNNRVAASVVGGLGAVGLGALLWSAQVSQALAGLIGVVLLWAEVVIYRRHLRRVTWTQFAAVASLLLGLLAFAVSRTGGPLCDPDSWLQGHGLWHVLSALALGLWGVGALADTAGENGTAHREVQRASEGRVG